MWISLHCYFCVLDNNSNANCLCNVSSNSVLLTNTVGNASDFIWTNRNSPTLCWPIEMRRIFYWPIGNHRILCWPIGMHLILCWLIGMRRILCWPIGMHRILCWPIGMPRILWWLMGMCLRLICRISDYSEKPKVSVPCLYATKACAFLVTTHLKVWFRRREKNLFFFFFPDPPYCVLVKHGQEKCAGMCIHSPVVLQALGYSPTCAGWAWFSCLVYQYWGDPWPVLPQLQPEADHPVGGRGGGLASHLQVYVTETSAAAARTGFFPGGGVRFSCRKLWETLK